LDASSNRTRSPCRDARPPPSRLPATAPGATWPFSTGGWKAEPLSRSQLRRLLRSAREAAKARPQEEARRLDLLRLDQLQAVHFAKAIAGDNPATDRVLAIMDRRAKLLAAPPTAQETAESESARKALLEKLNAIAARLMGAGAG
jgi:hypothetical protein